MINANVSSLAALVAELQLQFDMLQFVERRGVLFSELPEDPISDEIRVRLRGWIGNIGRIVAGEFELSAFKNRMDRLLERLTKPTFSNGELLYEIRTHKEAIEDDLKFQMIYRYSFKNAEIFRNWKVDWNFVIEVFPSSAPDIRSGVDLWALGHGTASVFHMMRVLEYGITGLAINLGVSHNVQVWHVIISQIEASITKEQKKPKSLSKDERLKFLSEAAKELRYFKDGWRNYVSHNKCIYNVDKAESVMEHTRQFMISISIYLSDEDLKMSNKECDQIRISKA